jgi:alpha-tubulin suppressor-like RCC1 family protein
MNGTKSVTATFSPLPPVTTLTTSPASPDGTNGWFETTPTVSLTSSKPGTIYYQWGAVATGYNYSTQTQSWVAGGTALNIKGLDVGNWYNLPFNFTFYGTTYTQVYLSTHGLIRFGTTDVTYSNSAASLKTKTAIAPLWDDTRTDQRTGDDVYVFQPDPDSVGFRWQTITTAGSYDTNVEAILYRDGRIKFNYGAQAGGLTPTIGISKGDGTSYNIPYDSNLSTTNNMASILYTPAGWSTYITTITPPASGDNTLNYYSVDTTGTSETAKSQHIKVDATAPLSSSSVPGGVYNTSKSVTLSCSDTGGSGCAATYYCLGTGCTPTTAYSNAIAITTSTDLRFYSMDVAGNIETTKTTSYTINVDSVPPTTTATPGGGTYSSTQNITLSCNDNGGSGCATTYYCLGTGCTPTTVYSSAIAVTTSTDLKFYSKDVVGNSETVQTASYTINYALTVTEAGTGSGTVTGTNISCTTGSSTGCSSTFASGTVVTLTAAPDASSAFASWTGACTTTSGNQCTVTMNGAKSVTATFTPLPPITTLTTNPASPDGTNGWFVTTPTISMASSKPGTTYYLWGASNGYSYTTQPSSWLTGGTAQNIRGDDTGKSYTMPFGFPFYGTTYTSVYVSSNGLMRFDTSDTSYTNSGTSLKAKVAIAPLWDDLITSNRTGDDIYVFQPDADSICFRWQAITLSGSYDTNFEAILYKDGRIKFNYGAQVGGLTPTIGISKGDGTTFNIPYDNNLTTTNNMSSILYTPAGWSTYTSTLTAASGDNILNYYSVDTIGTTETAKSQHIKVDTSAPVSSASVAGGAYNTSKSVTLSCSDTGGSGCATTYYCLGTGCAPTTLYSSTITIAASTDLRFYSKDTAGNSETVKTITYTIDTLSPTTTATPSGGTYTTAQNVALSCSDGTGSGCAGTWYCLGSGCTPSNVYSNPIAISTSTDLRFYSKDTAGNSEVIKTATYTINIVTYSLTVTESGSGSGNVTGTNISCTTGSTTGCSSTFASGTVVTLTASADTISVFAGWTGACTTISANKCTVTMNADTQVGARFEPVNPLISNVALAAGEYHTVLLKGDGTVWTWGSNSDGQLGDGSTTSHLAPVQVQGISDISAIATRKSHTVAMKPDGTVWTWGRNSSGQLGDGTTTSRSIPGQVTGLTGVIAVAAGCYQSIALKGDGTVWAWGLNSNGQLGDGTTSNKSTPVQVTGLINVIAIDSGCYHTVALKSDGTVWSWGYNYNGQLGDGTTVNRLTPVQVPGLAGITALSPGSSFTEVLHSDGSLWGWGNNSNGQLGDGTTAVQYSPVRLQSLSQVISARGGGGHMIALKGDKTVSAWGTNSVGQLGDGTTTQRTNPVQLAGISDVFNVAAGEYHSVAVKLDGTVWSWGLNNNGQLGDGTTTNHTSPVQLQGFALIEARATISGTPSDPSNSTSATLTVGGTGVVSYKYKLDAGSYSAETDVATPISLTGLSESTHIVSVLGKDSAGNWQVTPTTVSWTVDLPPTAIIVGTPANPTTSTSATLIVSGTDVVSYKYKLDASSYSAEIPVATPLSLTGLSENTHTVSVLGKDSAGNWQVTPTTVSWAVDITPPTTTISGTPASPTTSTSATLIVSGTDVVAYKFTLDSGSYSAEISVATPINLTGLSESTHTVSVLGRDSAGNWQVTPTTVSWTVDRPISIPGIGVFQRIRDAYNALLNDNILQIKGEIFTEDLVFDRDVNITLKGGYDPMTGTSPGFASLQGSMVISAGSVIVENLVIMAPN